MTTVSIGTVAELQAFATRVNAGETDLDAILTADITFTSSDTWTRIGTSSNAYAGTFDGNGHTISNITGTSIGTDTNLLFYLSGTTGTVIKNTCFDYISLSGSSSNYQNGRLIRSTGVNAVIENCIFSNITLSATTTGGGGTQLVIGYLVTVRNCIVDTANIYAKNTASSYVGMRIAPFAYSNVSNVYVSELTEYSSRTSGDGAMGGISSTGSSTVTTYTTIDSIILNSALTHSANSVGRVSMATTISNCYAGDVTTDWTVTSNKDSFDGQTVSSSVYNQQGFWDGTGVSGTTYLSWDFTDTWYWDTTDSLPKLQVFRQASAPTVKVFNATSNTWVDGTPYVFNGTSWVEADAVYVYVNGSWVEKT